MSSFFLGKVSVVSVYGEADCVGDGIMYIDDNILKTNETYVCQLKITHEKRWFEFIYSMQ